MVVLPLVSGLNSATARGVSADGSVIVGSDFAPSPQAGWVWTQSGGTVLVSIPGYDHPWLSALSADGSLAGGTATLSNRTHAFLWSISGHTAAFLPDPFPTGHTVVLAVLGQHKRHRATAATRLVGPSEHRRQPSAIFGWEPRWGTANRPRHGHRRPGGLLPERRRIPVDALWAGTEPGQPAAAFVREHAPRRERCGHLRRRLGQQPRRLRSRPGLAARYGSCRGKYVPGRPRR